MQSRETKGVTIQDIARIAGVSKSTVSRVLNDTAAVNPEKRQAVLEASERLGFKPNVVARSLARGRSMTIGVMTQLIGSPFYDGISQGVIAGLSGTGYSPIFVDGRWERDEEHEAIRALLGRRVDGLLLIGGQLPGHEIDALCDGLPTVLLARSLSGEGHRCVSMDNGDGGYQATKHLIEHGHRRIAMICGHEHHPDARERASGYERALREADIPLDPSLRLQGDFSADSGERALEELISQGTRFTAVFASNDLMAFGARLALYRHGVDVPGAVSVVGFDDQLESAYMTPPLTTIRQPARLMGELGASGVLSLIQGESFSSRLIGGELVERESVASVERSP